MCDCFFTRYRVIVRAIIDRVTCMSTQKPVAIIGITKCHLLPIHVCFCDSSRRWLVELGRVERLFRILRKWNHVPVTNLLQPEAELCRPRLYGQLHGPGPVWLRLHVSRSVAFSTCIMWLILSRRNITSIFATGGKFTRCNCNIAFYADRHINCLVLKHNLR